MGDIIKVIIYTLTIGFGMAVYFLIKLLFDIREEKKRFDSWKK